MRSRTVASVVPAVGFSLLPTITCPACLPALASVLGAAGLSFIAEPRYLLWVNLAALLIALAFLARGERRWVSVPLGLAAAGATAVMLGKFVWISSWVWWSGLAVFLLGSLWSGVRRRASKVCTKCESLLEED